MITVDGYCPLGCGETLFLSRTAQSNCIRCAHPSCPRPTAAAEILADPETGHIADITLDGQFTVRHPLRERLDGALLRCGLHELLAGEDAPWLDPGRYRAEMGRDCSWNFTRLASSS